MLLSAILSFNCSIKTLHGFLNFFHQYLVILKSNSPYLLTMPNTYNCCYNKYDRNKCFLDALCIIDTICISSIPFCKTFESDALMYQCITYIDLKCNLYKRVIATSVWRSFTSTSQSNANCHSVSSTDGLAPSI